LFLLTDWNSEGIGVKLGVWFMKDDYLDVKNSMFRSISSRLSEEGIRLSLPRISVDTAGPGADVDP
jgi:hypothetical protein